MKNWNGIVSRLTIIALSCVAGVTPAAPVSALEIKQPAPAFQLKTLEGEEISLASLKGSVVYVDFWASWCGPCKHSLPWMNELQEKFGPSGLKVVAINVDEDSGCAKKAMRKVNPHYTVLLDPQKEAVARYEPPTMPSSFIIGRDGRIAHIHEGFKSGDADAIERTIAALLKS